MTSRTIVRATCLGLYYGFARHLPASNTRLGRWTRPIRRAICRRIFRRAGVGINVERGAYFGNGAEIEIGDYSGIGVDCDLRGVISIGRDVMMGPECIIMTGLHRYDRLDIPMRLQGRNADRPVVIGDDVWIGTRVIILPGVRIGKGVILGAGAVVSRDVPDYAIAAGVPARVIRYRTGSALSQERVGAPPPADGA